MGLMDVIKKRRSIRSYKQDSISEETLNKILRAGQLAPTGNNTQPWKAVVVDQEEKRSQVNDACDQDFIGEASIVIAVCSQKEAKGMNATVVADHMILAAADEGLGSCWIRSFDENRVKEILDIPEDVHVVTLIPMGYPAEDAEFPGRKDIDELVSYNKY